VLEGHERGVNWVCFHPTQNLIASASDDRKIKLWKYTNEVAWEHSTLPGHKNNVSCVMFDKKTGLLISNSEDRTTKIWNIETKT
jgi:coatomer protein complex subunit alpha (xenin)